jgi:hypothetical protein
MKHTRFDQHLPGPWVLCALLAVTPFSKLAMADPLRVSGGAHQGRNYERKHRNARPRQSGKALL